jgi:shikimate dehydrogenase
MIKACVIGWPISHSRSPLIHGYWLRKYRIDGTYTRQPVEPAELAKFITSMRDNGLAGCNVTIPHKESVFRLVTPADQPTAQIGAVNTVYIQDGTTYGTNTDGEGFLNSLKAAIPHFNIVNTRVVLLGGGGAALSIVHALLGEGAAEIAVANRSAEKAEDLRKEFGNKIRPVVWERRSESLHECSLVVNATSLGMKGQPELDLDLSRLDPKAVVTDIVYTPLRTRLLITAARRGNPVVEGLGMLLHQAVRGFELWFGVRPAVTDELYDLVARDIEPGYRR